VLKIYKNLPFVKWQRKNKVSDKVLEKAIKEMESSLIDANLGGNLFKKRIARAGSGKSSGYRTILALKRNTAWFFIYGYSKNELENIETQELSALKEYANDFLFPNVDKLVNTKQLYEVQYEKKE
jgi:hypothetical protein